MTQASDNKLGALWVNEPKSDKSPVLTGEIDGQRVVVFKNRRWTKEDQKTQPLYQVYIAKKAEAKTEVKAEAKA